MYKIHKNRGEFSSILRIEYRRKIEYIIDARGDLSGKFGTLDAAAAAESEDMKC